MHPPRDAAVAPRCAGLVEGYVAHCNNVRLNSAIGYITPKDMLARASAGDSCRARSEVGGGEGTAEESPPAGRVTDETDYFRFADNTPRIVRDCKCGAST
jgi:hypothetical protein